MRRWIPDYTDAGISRERYQELLHFARQYPEWKSKADACLGTTAVKLSADGGSHGSGISDPTFQAVLRRERFEAKRILVDKAAITAGGAEWFTTLILNVCYGRPLWQLEQATMPTSDRNSYYRVRKRFFIELDQLLNAI